MGLIGRRLFIAFKFLQLCIASFCVFLSSYFLMGCSISASTYGGKDRIISSSPIGGIAFSPLVETVYPTNSNWNDYVRFDNDNGGTNYYNQDDAACTGAETGYYGQVNGCIHGGEKRKVVATGNTSCVNLTITDDLNAFDWTCKVEAGVATFYSIGLKSEKGLSDLVDATAWKSNGVTVRYLSSILGTSTSTTWWTNPVVALPATPLDPIILDGVDDDAAGTDQVYTAGTVFTLAASDISAGYNINLDKVSLVTLAGSTLTYNSDNITNCDDSTGEVNASLNSTDLICAGTQKFLWIEGNFKGDAVPFLAAVFDLVQIKYSRFNKLNTSVSLYESILLNNSSSNKLTQIKSGFSKGNAANFSLRTSSKNIISGLQISNNVDATVNSSNLLVTGSSNGNIFHNIATGNSYYAGIEHQGGANNTYTKILASAARVYGMTVHGGTASSLGTTISHITTANTESAGLFLEAQASGADNVTLNLALLTNSSGAGALHIQDSVGHLISQLMTSFSNSYGINIISSLNNKFTNNVLSGNTLGCNVTSSTNAGVTNACTIQGTSDANMVVSDATYNVTNSFVGKVASDSNLSDTAGTAVYNTITDFLNFDHMFRNWGLDGSAFPNADNKGTCATTSVCRIWDWRLRSTDTVALNKTLNGATSNTAFVMGASCPAAVDGNNSLTDQQSSPNTFLVNALEIISDEVGDDDGLCESSEACLYSPNFGAYQGEGDYLTNGACEFQDGVVSGVTMYAYPTNGG